MHDIKRYLVPVSLEEAVRAAAEGDATLLAGGTDLMPQTRTGARSFSPTLINLKRVPGLRGVSRENGNIRLGALTTVTDVLNDVLLREAAPVLPETADHFASDQVRNSATIGGNICNASPAGDMIIPLLLLDAVVELASWNGEAVETRSMPLEEFFVGPGRTKRQPGEILTAVRFPVPGEGFIARFVKFGTRPALDISVVSIGVAGVKENGTLRRVRMAFGAVAPVPVRGRTTEAAVEGRPLTAETIRQASEATQEDISPISDVRASAWYRRELVRTLTTRILNDVSTS
ncbi:MAG: xanthine dehydrogenase family protein subunit M [Chlorobi bacterium]|nr:xanthine dehydrogenase family protein subunit M [Chlorobiota bacterium]